MKSMEDTITLFKSEFQNLGEIQTEIPDLLNKKYLSGNNQKYMKMYNWMSYGYDIVEAVVGKLKYGNQVNQTRQDIMNKLEWKNNLSVLYVSIGTGKKYGVYSKNH